MQESEGPETEGPETEGKLIRGIDRPRVDAWVTRNVPGATAPFDYQLIAAGGSNLTFRVTDAAGHAWALRRPPVGHALPTAHDMSREWRIMSALEGTGVPVPYCIAYCDDVEVNGAPFYVMSFVEGQILRDRASVAGMTPEQADVATDSLIDVQIAFHTVDLDAIGLANLAKREDYVGRQLNRWRTQVERANVREVPLLHELHDRLVTAKPIETARPGLAHGDYRFDNTVLGADFTIVAVLDWELCTIGDPVADFAWSLQYWADPGDTYSFLSDPPTLEDVFVRRDEVARRYEKRSGLDLTNLPYYAVFSWWKQACIVEGAYARRLAGATGGMKSAGDPSDIGRRADALLEHAAELARGVL
jgi:aminoglycoside phosphotransferase (APT) family kinase protein